MGSKPQAMLLTIGKFAIVVAIAFTGGVFLGRDHPSDHGVANWYEQRLGANWAKDLQGTFDSATKGMNDALDEILSPTPTPSP